MRGQPWLTIALLIVACANTLDEGAGPGREDSRPEVALDAGDGATRGGATGAAMGGAAGAAMGGATGAAMGGAAGAAMGGAAGAAGSLPGRADASAPPDPMAALPLLPTWELVARGVGISARVVTADARQLGARLAEISDAGETITAATTVPSGYLLVASRSMSAPALPTSVTTQSSSNEALASDLVALGKVGRLTSVALGAAGGFTLLVQAVVADEPVEAQVARPTGVDLPKVAAALAASGAVISAVTTTTQGYAVFSALTPGTRAQPLDAHVQQVSGKDLPGFVIAQAAQGYVVVGLSEIAAGFTLILQRRGTGFAPIQARVDQTPASAFGALAVDLGSKGFVIAALASGAGGLTSIAMKGLD